MVAADARECVCHPSGVCVRVHTDAGIEASGPVQVKALMVAAQVLPLDRLEQLLPSPAGAVATAAMGEARRQEILAQLPRHAVLVQGVWVVKSEHMYKDDSKNQAQVDALRVYMSR